VRPAFHRLRVAAVTELADDAVALTFDVPEGLREAFAHRPGQHVAVRVPGEQDRRAYSVCSAPGDALRIGVKRLPGGAFSGAVLERLAIGDELEVLTPSGRFGAALPGMRRPAFVAGGSGITPILGLVRAALADSAVEAVTLIDCNGSQRDVMFLDELADLKNSWPARFQLLHVLTREAQESPLLSVRLDAETLATLRRTVLGECDGWFLCGPFGMVRTVADALVADGVPAAAVHTELFHAETGERSTEQAPASIGANVVVTLGGLRSRFTLAPGEAVLDGLLRVRADAPYACQGGVCGTCRARLTQGEVTMAATWALEPDEQARGDVLTCQARPVSGDLVLDFDA
jgi:ring-1,2-phenylacetyl-CoA epoxidase subunit PaaE